LVSSWSLSALCDIPTKAPLGFSLAKSRYEQLYHEMDVPKVFTKGTMYKIFTGKLLQAKKNSIVPMTTTYAALLVAEKCLDTLFKYKLHKENLDTRLQLFRQEVLLNHVFERLEDMSVMIEAIVDELIVKKVDKKRKAKVWPILEELLHGWQRELARFVEKLQEFESIYTFS
jgi:hypothetical protein